MGNLGTAAALPTASARRAQRLVTMVVIAAALGAALVAMQPSPRAEAASPCGADINPVVCENENMGTDPEVWDIEGAGDPTIQGFATDISVNAGSAIDFKIDTDAADYDIDIYRTGWYQGKGARFIQSVEPSLIAPQANECRTDEATELYDCGTWDVSATWNVPASAVSGVYIALLDRADTGGQSHITFIVRNDGNTSDVLFQTSDPTWHAYNIYGGSDFYAGAANGRAYKVSYNRPFATRQGLTARDFYFSSEYATVRFLERNGYDVSYLAGVDTDRRGSELLNHNVFLSVGHDEYWSGAQRANIEAARDAGVNLQFLTGNEGYWRTRYEPSIDDSHADYRTLVSYKETWSRAKIDPSPEWTGTWRDPRFADASQGGHLPENSLTGTMFMVNEVYLPLTVSSEEGKNRLWRGTSLGSLTPGTSAQLTEDTVGYESNEDVDNGFRPEGLIRLSTTVGTTPEYLRDYGNTVTDGTTKHHITLYRAASGALVFSAASVQWAWGLDSDHDGPQHPADQRMQQAQVNLLADMGARPGSIMPGLVATSASSDTSPPTTTITSPPPGATAAHGSRVTVTGAATDSDGRVAGVEVSTDEGRSWHAAEGTTSWSYSYIQQGSGTTAIIARAIDDSANFSPGGTTRDVEVIGPYSVLGEVTPEILSVDDDDGVELGLRFSSASDGFVTGVRFYKGPANTGTHTGSLWDEAGNRLATVVFDDESASGWQEASFTAPVEILAGTTYTVSYTAPQGGYSMTGSYWPYKAGTASPLTVSTEVGAGAAGVFGNSGTRPVETWHESNYFVDVAFESSDTSPLRIASRSPQADASSTALEVPITGTFTRAADPASVALIVRSADGQEVPGTVSYNEQTRTVRFSSTVGFSPATRYTVVPTGSDENGVELAADSGWSFTTQSADLPEGQCPCSLFLESSRPIIESTADDDLVTLGVRFAVSTPGAIAALKFFKGSANTGPHRVALWGADGVQLAEADAVAGSSHGWQTVYLDQAVDVVPGETYLASYLAPAGGYSSSVGQFGASGYTRGPLSVPANGGAFTYADGFPSQSSSTNYAMDLVFEDAPTAPTATNFTPERDASDASADTTLSVGFSHPIAAGVAGSVRANGAAVEGNWLLSTDGRSLEFSPATALPSGAAVTVDITAVIGTDGTAGPDVSWSFQVADSSPSVTTFFGDAAPALTAVASEAASVELGMAFRSSVAGEVRAIRFYKGAGTAGTHTGSLWSPTGERLAEVAFVGGGTGGWQRAVLPEPVEIQPGALYTVSYFAPQGRYAYKSGGLGAPVTSGPLTAESPANGRYRYGAGGAMPDAVWDSTNYFADVEFVVDSDDPHAPPTVAEVTPARDATGVPVGSSVTAALDRMSPELSLTLSSEAGVVTGEVAVDPGSAAVSFVPSTDLAPYTTYTAVVTLAGATLDSWTFRTARAPVTGTAETLFGNEMPAIAAAADNASVEVGTAFHVAQAGAVTAIRFYKGESNTGTHRGTLWSSSGEVLARVTFSHETASGWQRAELTDPIEVLPGESYVVSYLAPTGRFAVQSEYFQTAKVSGRITAPAVANGRFLYAAEGGFPTYSWSASSYFVDAEVVFAEPEPLAPITLQSTTPDGGAAEVAPTEVVSAVLSADESGATIGLSAADGPVAGAGTYDSGTRTVAFTPSEPLDWGATYTATVSVPGRGVLANSWSFTTVGEPVVRDAVSIFGDALPQHAAWDDPDTIQVGTRFTVDTAGWATAIRFYKGAANTGEHTGFLWRDGLVKLAELNFADETADGWQTAIFDAPIDLVPGVEYRVGLHSTTGRYAVDLGAFADPTTFGHFAIPADGGTYTYSRDYPVNLSRHNYWVDVLFVPSG
ncbi:MULTISPECIES: DUF4082 domain-containing protein [unclassified Microbacterium]|uniref:DUF4082 domain-containing protein n=1 Tax=unclassified Microbacterium TaxID=2609290 RepID=UPI00214A9493|nr:MULTISPECIES: DUF4082 domain-containing protein [unclassified Microbacterium]MCR2784988.1 DUF4082 domain-containing protein [Microbacterium sp. zg.B96]WIM16527.1 DUF4082 domain-containing protein [Microbacterium sp. zg-B96]